MPAYRFCGFQPTFFSGLRDAEGRQLGYVNPGDVVELEEVPHGAPFVLAGDGGAESALSNAAAAPGEPGRESAAAAPPAPPAPEAPHMRIIHPAAVSSPAVVH